MFLDTSIIIEIFLSGDKEKAFLEIFEATRDEPAFISVIQPGGISDWCIRNDIDPEGTVNRIKQAVNMTHLSERICIEGSRVKSEMRMNGERKFSLMEGMILASARSIDQKLLTKDKDFKLAGYAIVY